MESLVWAWWGHSTTGWTRGWVDWTWLRHLRKQLAQSSVGFIAILRWHLTLLVVNRGLQWRIMGCSASVVLLLRSVGGADCGHMCSQPDQMSLDATTPTLEGYTTTTSPLTIIVMVTNTSKPPFNSCLMHATIIWLWSKCGQCVIDPILLFKLFSPC